MSKSNTSQAEAPPTTYHTTHDWTDAESLSTTVMTAVAEAMDKDPTEIGPLYDQFDPDALDGLFSPHRGEKIRTDGHLGFTFEEHYIFVQSDGLIAVHPPEEGT
ncbi:HalOD1 output domain-containing protein [Haladaptatus pallidirubidus]|uniref:Halobacterial output domain-containing protein n=1 Tax=Haladaptatus pallidirubidus TaxID=1008152 RepID=A0AAV3UK70_9EURY|nr:HalOD1 output domain-containing protein [Haladaptatus pallidirubidus]